jgi:hypothetical protein
MIRPITATLLVTYVLCATQSASQAAPPNPKKYAVTDPAKVDDDFAYQGEYTGVAYVEGHGCSSVGLQVVARGDGKFDATMYLGGLPGAGWDAETRWGLSGSLSDGVLALEGEDYVALTNGHSATLHYVPRNTQGQAHRTKRGSPTLGLQPPDNAVVLFDGTSVDNLEGGRITEDGLLDVGPTTKMPVRDFRLHLEFRLPYMPYASGQSRGNSGVYIQRRYEVQILDSFGLEGVYNECGALYRQQPPDINMCLPPLTWQTYDIHFTAARFDDEAHKTANARITVIHNGVAVHDDYEIVNKTGAGRPEGPDPMPILLQNHSDPVRFRNVWIVLGDQPKVKECAPSQRPVCQPQVCRPVCKPRVCYPRRRSIFWGWRCCR